MRRGAGSLPGPVGVPPAVAGASHSLSRGRPAPARGQDARVTAGETPAPHQGEPVAYRL